MLQIRSLFNYDNIKCDLKPHLGNLERSRYV